MPIYSAVFVAMATTIEPLQLDALIMKPTDLCVSLFAESLVKIGLATPE